MTLTTEFQTPGRMMRPHCMMLTRPDRLPDCAIDIVRLTWQQHGIRSFDRELAHHLREGFVFSLPRLFVMAKPVELDDGRRAWLVSEAYGPLRSILSVMPWPLEWLAWHRRFDRQLRVYRTERFQRLVNRRKR